MKDAPPSARAEGDQETLLFILSVLVGGAAMVLVTALMPNRLLGETCGFFAAWMGIYPFARRTWAAGVPFRRYLAGGVMAAAIGAALRIVEH